MTPLPALQSDPTLVSKQFPRHDPAFSGTDRLALLRCVAWITDAARRHGFPYQALLQALNLPQARQIEVVIETRLSPPRYRSPLDHPLPAPPWRVTEEEFLACLPLSAQRTARRERWHLNALTAAVANGEDIPQEVLSRDLAVRYGRPHFRTWSNPTQTSFEQVQWDRPNATWPTPPENDPTAWARKHWDTWAISLDYDEFEALQLYKHGWNEPTWFLRGLPIEGDVDVDRIRRRIAIMDVALGRAILPEDTVMWRGSESAFMRSYEPGQVHRYMGYLSCSSLKEFAERWGIENNYYPAADAEQPGMLELRFPKGYPIAYFEYFWDRGNQYEFVSQRGLTWRVERVIANDEHGYFRVVANILPRLEAHSLIGHEPWLAPRHTTNGLDIDEVFPLV